MTSLHDPFPMPVRRTEDSADFFDAARDGKLLLRQCISCWTMRGPREKVCPECHESDFLPTPADGRGTIVSWSVVHRSPVPGLDGPYTVAIIECREGPWLALRLLTDSETTFQAGDPVLFVACPSGADGEPIIAARLDSGHR